MAEPSAHGLSESEAQSFSADYLSAHGSDHAIDLLRVLPSTSSDLIVVYDRNANLVYGSPATERILGFRSVRDVDQSILEMVHPDDQERCVANMLRALETPGINPASVYRVRTADGGWRSLEVIATNCMDDPRIEGVVLNLRDVTRTVELQRAYATFGHANQALMHAQSEAELFERTCQTIVDVGGYAEAWIGEAREDADQTVAPVAAAGRVEHLAAVTNSWADDPRGQGPVGRALRSGQLQSVRDLVASGVPDHARALLEREGLRACCAMPLECGDGTRRVLVIADAEVREFEDEELQLFGELADNLAFGLREIQDAQSLVSSETRFRTLAASSPIGILESTADGSVIFANERMAEMLGTEVSDLLDRGWSSFIEPDDRQELFNTLGRWTREDVITSRYRIRRTDGELRTVQTSVAPKSDGGADGFVATVADVTDEVRAQEELTRLALVDPLTGLPNRTQFLLELRKRLQHRRRLADTVALLFVDLDHLKLVNDSLGHDAGDAIIVEASRRFAATIRAGTIAARFGGDEFMFLVKDGGQEAALHVAERLLVALQAPFELRGLQLAITGSVGIAVARRGDTPEGLVRDADTALYRAKEQGRNRIVQFDDELRQRTLTRLSVETDLSVALARHELLVEYQPIVDARSGRPVGAEALLRWQHPSRGIVPPLEFVGVAEDLGLIVDIGAWVLEESATQLVRWDRDGPKLDFVAVNVSSRQLEYGEPAAWIEPALQRAGVDPARIEIEVTESVAMDDFQAADAALRELRQLGLTIAIDDFGTGFSSLSYLQELPITTVKIDGSFIARLTRTESSAPIVHAIVEMSHALGLRVVAEGVSNESRRELVARLGCDLAQGFVFATPMRPEAFAAWWQGATKGPEPVASQRFRRALTRT
jgi:diguanylate cyclase (GGDEF)-like protein/PAS domain S-box-containing protein